MSLFSGPEEHAANPPETWIVEKADDRIWQLKTAAGVVLETRKTRKAALAERESGWWVNEYRKDARWYAGEYVHPRKPWAQVQAERERHARWLESRKLSTVPR